MRVVVDLDLCEGHGMCESIAPHHFQVNDDTEQAEVLQGEPSEADRDLLVDAARRCPRQAITVE